MIHLNFDLETLGKKERAVVGTLACVPFSFERKDSYEELIGKSFFIKFDIAEQIQKYSRTVEKDTVDWWKLQSKEARENNILPKKGDVSLQEGMDRLVHWIKEESGYNFHSSFLWSRGNYFDYPMIIDMLHQTGYKDNMPINTFKVRDTRTYIDVLTGSGNGKYQIRSGDPAQFTKHDALSDAVVEIMRMQDIYQSLTVDSWEDDDIPF